MFDFQSCLSQTMSSHPNLYFDSNRIRLSATNGSILLFHPDYCSISHENPPDRMQPIDEVLVVPAIPGRDILMEEETEEDSTDTSSNGWTRYFVSQFSQPLWKDENGEIEAYQSGIRSAILPWRNQFIRLKGCGNNYDKFPLREATQANIKNAVEIRGCCFEFTGKRELYYTHKISSLLKQHLNWKCGNESLGLYRYQLDKDAPFLQIDRCCALFFTRGEKRLGDHLLLGLEKILPLFVESFHVDNTFPQKRYMDGELLSTDMMVICEGEFGEPENLWSCASIHESTIALRKEGTDLCCSQERWNELLDKIDIGLKWMQTHGSVPCSSLLVYIYFHLGFQVGITHKLLHSNNINWGTYTDQLATMHCNAHPNNFVVLPQTEAEHNQWIAPVDFDMAYDFDSFIADDITFTNNMATEKQALKTALCGMDINSGAKGVNFETQTHKPLLIGLRDTLICGFNADQDQPYFEELEDSVHALIQVALLMTMQDIA